MALETIAQKLLYSFLLLFFLVVPTLVFAPSDWYVADKPGKPIPAETQPPVQHRGDLVRIPIYIDTAGGVAIGYQIVWQYDPQRLQVVRIATTNSPFYVEPPSIPTIKVNEGELVVAGATKRPGWQGKGVIGYIEGYLIQDGPTSLIPLQELTKIWVRNREVLDRLDLHMDTILLGGSQ